MPKLFLLDAYALIFRAYYAFIKNPRINSRGVNTSAVLGFVNTLEELLREQQPTHVGVAFDPSGPTFRHEAYPPYKAQREATPEAIRVAVPLIKRVLEAYRIPVLEVSGFEADDVIGTLAHQAAAAGIDTYMMTPDKDYCQLVAPRVSMYRPGTGSKPSEVLGPEEVCAKYGIARPEQVIDMLGLMGDAADNIPGCPGVGEKTAVKLIQQFGSVDELLSHTDALKGALKTKVEANVDQIRQSRWLATIRLDVPVALDMDALALQEPDLDALTRLYEELEFKMLLKKKNAAPAAAPSDGYAGDLFTPAPAPQGEPDLFSLPPALDSYSPERATYHLVDTTEARAALVARLLAAPLVCLDTETTSLTALDARLVGLSFAIEEGEAWYVPVPQDDGAAQTLMDAFRPVYENEASLKVGQNLKYDLTVLQNYGITLRGPLADTMIAHYLIAPELRHGMDYMAEIYLHYQTIPIEQLIGTGRQQRSMADVPPADVCPYAAEDADITLRLWHVLEPKLAELGLTKLFHDVEMPLMPVLAYMERCGVRIDTEGLQETSRLFTSRMNALEEEIHTLAGAPFNISSPKQVGEILFERLRLDPKARKTRKGQYATSEDILEKLRAKHPVVDKILAYRGLKKLLGTYIDALPALISPRTGHIHTSFNQTVAATGRLSSSNPNLQNIPVREAEGKEVRKAFIPEEGCLFFSADYSQIELRIMAHLSHDEHLIEAFRAGHDVHRATAARIFHVALDDVLPEQRRRAKTANFGIIYGISAFGLAERMGVTRQEAKELIDEYFDTYPAVRRYMDESIARAREQGYVETLFGRRLALPDINSRNSVVRGYAERNAINAPIQGTAADIIKIAMIRIYRRLQAEHLRAKMILQVHDELNFTVPPEERDALQRLVIEEMEGAAQLSVPLVADAGWGTNWLEAH